MGSYEWNTVMCKKRKSVFQRLGKAQETNEMQLQKVSTTIYICNFPGHLIGRICERVGGGDIVCEYIHVKRNNLGQMYSFV